MPEKAWKVAERRVAKFFGVSRVIGSGLGGYTGEKRTKSDSDHDELFIENKYRRDGHSVFNLWKETAKIAQEEDKVPVVTLAQKGDSSFMICVNSKDLDEFIRSYVGR